MALSSFVSLLKFKCTWRGLTPRSPPQPVRQWSQYQGTEQSGLRLGFWRSTAPQIQNSTWNCSVWFTDVLSFYADPPPVHSSHHDPQPSPHPQCHIVTINQFVP